MKEFQYYFRRNQAVMIGAILILAALSTVPVLAKGRITSTITAEPSAELTPEESQAVSVAAGRILRHVNEARMAIEEKNTKAALEDVAQGLKLVKIIQNALPPIKVKADIQSGNIKYQSEEQFQQPLIPIFQELDQVDVIGPTARAKKEANHTAATKSTGSSAITYSGEEFTSLNLDLPFAQRNLERSQKALKEKKLDAADSALEAIQTRGVLFDLIEDYLPLREAAENFKLAEFEVKQGQFKEAKAALKTASNALSSYEKTAREPRSKEVKALKQEIDDLSGKIDQQQDQEGVRKKIANWWQRVTHWLKG